MTSPALSLLLSAALASAPMVIGHRGTGEDHRNNPYPENTLPAIRAGFEEGADFVEVDVQLDAERVPVLWHDETVKIDGQEHPLREVARAEIPPRRGPTGIVAEVPTLRSALRLAKQLAPGSRKINLELKLHRAEDRAPLVLAVSREVRRAKMGRQVLVSSFDELTLVAMERALPGLESGLLSAASRDALQAVLRWRAAGRHIEWVLPDKRFELGEPNARDFRKLAHDEGVKVGVWTVNWRYQLKGFARLKYDAIITDVPDRASALFD